MMRKPALTYIPLLLSSLFLSSVVGSGFQTGARVQVKEIKAYLMADGGISIPVSPSSQSFTAAGFGTVGWEFTNTTGATLQNARFLVLLDADIDREINTFFNEYGVFAGLALPPNAPVGAIPASSWEIDEPGFLYGNILTNLSKAALDNNNAIPAEMRDDVSLALGYEIGGLPLNGKLTAAFFLSSTNIGGLSQVDPDSNLQIHFNGYAELALPPSNTPPTIAGTTLTRRQGSPAATATIANVGDAETPAGDLLVEPVSVPPGIEITGLTNTNGTVTAGIRAGCAANAGVNLVEFRVGDPGGLTATANLTIDVLANTPPELAYPGEVGLINQGELATIGPIIGPGDNGSLTSLEVQGTPGFSGSVSVNAAGVITISGAAPPGGPYSTAIRATDNCNLTTIAAFTFIVNGPPTVQEQTISRMQGSPSSNSTIAVVGDDLTPAGDLTVNVTTPAPGTTISDIANQDGTITANISADCTATVGANQIGLTVTDGNSLSINANLTVEVNADTPPALGNYASGSEVSIGGKLVITPDAAPSDNGLITSIKSSAAGFAGDISLNQGTGLISILNAGPPGTHTLTLTARDNCGLITTTDITFIVRHPAFACQTAGFSTLNNPQAGQAPNAIAVGYFDGNANPDLAVTNHNSNNVTILLGDGNGNFAEAAGSPVSVGAGPSSIAAGDFNADGNTDIAVANKNSDSVSILLGDGVGGFSIASGSPIIIGNLPKHLVAGDFNKNGIQDLAVANAGSNTVSILLGNGGGGFSQAPGLPISVGTSPSSVVKGDFNADNIPDLAVANAVSNSVTILLGDGEGKFNPAGGPVLLDGQQPESVAAGDIDGDGDLDLAVANKASNNLSILLGNGGGGFGLSGVSPLAAGLLPQSIAVGDLNGDRMLDLVAANSGSDNVTVFLGNVSGGFSASNYSIGGEEPAGLVVGDLNLDNLPDLAIANIATNNASILTNKCNTPPKFLSVASLSLRSGGPGLSTVIANVSDSETPAGDLALTASTPTGITVTNIANDNGAISAEVAAGITSTPGDNQVELTVTDREGASATASLIIRVEVDKPPILSIITKPIIFWPPNHKYQTVKMKDVVVSVSDDIDSLSINDVIITQVTSDEPEDSTGGGDGNTLEDILISADCRSVQLRAEREGSGNGRVYTIHLKVEDSSGNVATATAKVHVPKNYGAGSDPNAVITDTTVDDGPRYVVTGNNCKASQPPILSIITKPLVLWPPNNKYQTVRMQDLVISVSDDIDALSINDMVITKVTSDEPEDSPRASDGNTLNDIVIAADCRSVKLRSERNGNGNGRVYIIHLKVQDSSGNAATATAKVHVPRNYGSGSDPNSVNGDPAVDDGPKYAVSSSCK